ncbi:tectonic-1 [Turdus rufiventris]|nr:tectonic-1 [Turdus rufiventris]
MEAAPALGAFFVLILLFLLPLPPLRAEESAAEPADTRDAARVRSAPAPVTDVARLCVCDLLVAQCDVNCCCDPDCSPEDFSLFTTCSVPVVTGDSQLCSQKAAVYSLDVEANPPERIFKLIDQVNPSIFCIHATNYKQALYLKSPEIPTPENFDQLLEKYGGASFRAEPDSWDLDTDVQNPPETNETSRYEVPKSSQMVNITVQSVVVQSLNGMRTLLSSSDVLRLPMVLDELCINAVLGVNYHITHTDMGEIIEAAAAFVLGAISKEAISIEQSFEISFTQSSNKHSQLTILQSTSTQDCLAAQGARAPVLFGYNMISGCKLRITAAMKCQPLAQTLLDVLKGQSFPEYVASFGNSQAQDVLDWVPITQLHISEQSPCQIPVSLGIEVKWTKYGSLVNPQARIVNVTATITTTTLKQSIVYPVIMMGHHFPLNCRYWAKIGQERKGETL